MTSLPAEVGMHNQPVAGMMAMSRMLMYKAGVCLGAIRQLLQVHVGLQNACVHDSQPKNKPDTLTTS